jgi:hypothetical protein
MSRGGRSNSGVAGSVLASLALLTSAIWLPWATYRSSALTVIFKSGRLGPVLVACGAASIVLVVLSQWTKSSSPLWIQLVLGCFALLCSVTIALSRIADANRTVTIHTGSETTSYAIGAGLAIVASIGLAMAGVAQLGQRGAPSSPGSDPAPEIATIS